MSTSTTTMTLQTAEVLQDGLVLFLVLSGPIPDDYGAVDWYPGRMEGATKILSTGALFYFMSGTPVVNGDTLEWHAYFRIRDEGDRIEFGDSGITITASEGLLQDTDGNRSAAFTEVAVANYSWVKGDGFCAAIAPPAGAKTVYVSWAHGDDGRTVAQAGNPATPFKTLAYAEYNLFLEGHQDDGSHILMHEGETWPVSSPNYLRGSGPSHQYPHYIGHYWHDYGDRTGTAGARWKLQLADASGLAGIFRAAGGDQPSTIQYAIVDGGEIFTVGSSGSEVTGAYFLQPDAHVMLIDCLFRECATGLTFNNAGHHFAAVRCTFLDSHSTSIALGMFTAGMSPPVLVSECSFDRCGYDTRSDPPFGYGAGVGLSRSLYVSETTGAVCYWGGFNLRSPSEGVQLRNGGAINAVVIDQAAMSGFIAGNGGRVAMCVTLRSKDLSAWDSVNEIGVTDGRGFGFFAENSNTIIEGTIHTLPTTTYIGRYCVGCNTSTGRNVVLRNNTGLEMFGINLSLNANGDEPRLGVSRHNLVSNVASNLTGVTHVMASYASYAWMDQDFNHFFSTDPDQFAVMSGAFLTKAEYVSLTGQETNTGETAPVFVQEDADLGDWYASAGWTDDAAAFYAAVRGRALGSWPAWADSRAAVLYLNSRYQTSNLSTADDGVLGMLGVPAEDPSYLNPTTTAPLAVGQSNRARVTWTLTAEDLMLETEYFNVYRSDSEDGSYAKIGTAENPARYPGHYELTSADPPIPSPGVFFDYLVAAGQTWYYKTAPVTAGVEGSMSVASNPVTVASLPGGVPVPDTSNPVVPAPRSRLWLSWATASELAVVADYRAVNFDYDFLSTWEARLARDVDPVIALSADINHIIDNPWGKPQYITVAATGAHSALHTPLGVEVPTSEGGAGMLASGADTFGQSFLDAVEWSKTQAKARRLTDDFITAVKARTATGVHFSVYMSCMLASSSWDDSVLLGSAMLGEALAADCGVMIDTAYAIDKKLPSRGVHPAYRAAQLCLERGVPFWGEPLTFRADCRHWSRGDMNIGAISTGGRTLYARANPSLLISENEVLGLGHIIIMGLSPYWTATTYTDLYEAMLVELRAGHHVALTNGTVFMTYFTQEQREALIEAATAPAIFVLASALSSNVVSRPV